MEQTIHVEMLDGEEWGSVADAFLRYCIEVKKVRKGGCHEGDQIPTVDETQYAAICIPNHQPDLIGYLFEWAVSEGRNIYYQADSGVSSPVSDK